MPSHDFRGLCLNNSKLLERPKYLVTDITQRLDGPQVQIKTQLIKNLEVKISSYFSCILASDLAVLKTNSLKSRCKFAQLYKKNIIN